MGCACRICKVFPIGIHIPLYGEIIYMGQLTGVRPNKKRIFYIFYYYWCLRLSNSVVANRGDGQGSWVHNYKTRQDCTFIVKLVPRHQLSKCRSASVHACVNTIWEVKSTSLPSFAFSSISAPSQHFWVPEERDKSLLPVLKDAAATGGCCCAGAATGAAAAAAEEDENWRVLCMSSKSSAEGDR